MLQRTLKKICRKESLRRNLSTSSFPCLHVVPLSLKVPHRFRWVVEQTLREFFKAVLAGRDVDPSWKKQIYKVIARLDDFVPDYFKTQTFLEQLE